MDLIVAVTRDWGIGYGGTQPIVIPEDRKRFREITGDGAVIVGRKTLADFPGGRPLKNRRNIVLSTDPVLTVEGAEVAHTLREALDAAETAARVFVIGGAAVYTQFLPYCRFAYVTWIDAQPVSDTFFPNLDADVRWRLRSVDGRGEHAGMAYQFRTYENMDLRKEGEE